MKVSKVLLGAGAVVGLMSSTVAMAATRSSAAIPNVHAKAPVTGVRHAATVSSSSAQSDESMTGTYIVGGLAAAAVIAGVVVIASDDDNNGDNNVSGG
jgi:hypothetical protein